MQFDCSVDIDLSVDQVIALWSDVNNNKHWQDGFISSTPLEGEPGAVGSKAKLFFKQKGKEMELIETILTKNLPEEMTARYEHTHMINTMKNTFLKLGPTQTRWCVQINYTQFNGILPKLMSVLMPGVFKKQTQKWLDQFKVFAEFH